MAVAVARHRGRHVVGQIVEIEPDVGAERAGVRDELVADIGHVVEQHGLAVAVIVAVAPRDVDQLVVLGAPGPRRAVARLHVDEAARRIELVVGGEPAARHLQAERPVEPGDDVALGGLQVVLLAHRVERVAQVARAGEPIVGIAGQRLQHDGVERGRAALVERRWRLHVAALQLHQCLVLVLGCEQRSRREQLVGDHAGGEQIAAGVEFLAGERLGRHVGELAFDPAGLRAQLRRLRLGDPEVDDLDLAVGGHQHVRRRHVAVDQAERVTGVIELVVRVVERVAQLEQQPDRDVDRRRAADPARVAQDPADIAAVDVLHRDEVRRAHPAELEQLDDVGVVQEGGELGLAHERLDEAGVCREMRQQTLERHHAFEPFNPALERAMHRRHAAHPEPLEDEIRTKLLLCSGVSAQ